MATDPHAALVLRDEAGDCYLIPADALAQFRLPAARRMEVEKLLASEDTEDTGDTTGFIVPDDGAISLRPQQPGGMSITGRFVLFAPVKLSDAVAPMF